MTSFQGRVAGNRSALAVVAVGALAGLAAAAGLSALRRLLGHPVISAAVPGFTDEDSAAVTAMERVPDEWAEALPVGPAGPVAPVEIAPLDASASERRRTWVVRGGPEWRGLPGELMVPGPGPRRARSSRRE